MFAYYNFIRKYISAESLRIKNELGTIRLSNCKPFSKAILDIITVHWIFSTTNYNIIRGSAESITV